MIPLLTTAFECYPQQGQVHLKTSAAHALVPLMPFLLTADFTPNMLPLYVAGAYLFDKLSYV